MIVVGLIGRIGAGKSTVARLFASRGAAVIDADALAHAVLDEPDARAEIVARFGAEVLDGAGRVSRAALAARVFGGGKEAALRELEAIVHPRVRRRIDAALADLRAAEDRDGVRRIALLDVPLLVQAGLAESCDLVVVVECDERVRRSRLEGRGWSSDQVAAREEAWNRGFAARPAPRKMTAVDASADLAYTSAQVERIWVSLAGQ